MDIAGQIRWVLECGRGEGRGGKIGFLGCLTRGQAATGEEAEGEANVRIQGRPPAEAEMGKKKHTHYRTEAGSRQKRHSNIQAQASSFKPQHQITWTLQRTQGMHPTHTYPAQNLLTQPLCLPRIVGCACICFSDEGCDRRRCSRGFSHRWWWCSIARPGWESIVQTTAVVAGSRTYEETNTDTVPQRGSEFLRAISSELSQSRLSSER